MSRCFNTTGPCISGRHYMLPALERIPAALSLAEEGKYFVLHAPRQSGKTTSIRALRDELNRRGNCYAVYCSLEAQSVGSDSSMVTDKIARQIQRSVKYDLKKPEVMSIPLNLDDNSFVIQGLLSDICETLDKPLVLLLDEVDSIQGESLLSLLRQLRAGYISRDDIPYPSSVALVGMRNIRDYRAQIRPESESLGTGSPFNIVAEYLTIEVFTEEQIRGLYEQHTEDTGQVFEEEAIKRVTYWTGGQPWLVNAIALECVEEICQKDTSRPITAEMVDEAAHTIIRRRDVHIDSLLARLNEPRVRHVMEPVILGKNFLEARQKTPSFDNDLSLVLDLGLLRRDEKGRVVPANRMYAEVFLRTLSFGYQELCRDSIPAPSWARPDGLDMSALLKGFQQFWRENAEALTTRVRDYAEALPHLVLMGFLQRVVNGGGRIIREYAAGSGRLDLLVEFRGGRYPIELKVKGNSSPATAREQLLGYMDRIGCKEGWLVTFDRSPDVPWEDKTTWQTVQESGCTIHLVGA